MKTDTEYLQCLGLGLQGLRASGQFCDAMVCCGSTRILVHKVVLSAASKTLHDLALEFDMTPHRERDQLEIIIPPDVSLFAVNMFINYLYTGQLQLNERVVNHLLRLANEFGVTSLGNQCQEFIQRAAAPDSQDLNLREEKLNQTEPDSSCTNGVQLSGEGLFGNSEDTTQNSSLTRSSSRSSGIGVDQATFAGISIKSEPMDFDVFQQTIPNSPSTNASARTPQTSSSPKTSNQKDSSSMSILHRLMSPMVNIKKLPSNITPNVVVMVSDDEEEGTETGHESQASKSTYTLEEQETIAREAKRFGTTTVARQRNIPLADILKWMTLFGLKHNQKPGKQVNHDADLSIVRWVVQQQQLKGQVDLNSMKKCALNVYRQTNPSFTASQTWLENFLKRNMSVLQGTQFSVENEARGETDSGSNRALLKKEVVSLEDLVNPDEEQDDLDGLGNDKVLESVPDSEERMINEEVLGGFDDGEEDNSYEDVGSFTEDTDQTISTPGERNKNTGSVITPFGKRPIIIGQSKSFDAKSERKIVQWVLERNARDGYVFTDDFKDYARSLYVGTKPFGATQAWMKKFIRRNRAIKDIRFCSKFKTVYTNEEKVTAVAMARRFGTAYACKHTGINQKIIHSWRLAVDRGQLFLPPYDKGIPHTTVTSELVTPSQPLVSSSPVMSSTPMAKSNEALHGVVPEFEKRIISMMKEFQQKEGSINYKDISKISQSVYKETRPTFKASYSWIKIFLERHKEELRDLELENVPKVLIEETNDSQPGLSAGSLGDDLSRDKITELVDNALKEIDFQDDPSETVTSESKPAGSKRPVVIGPSVTFDRKTEKKLVEWALERQAQEGYVFTDDFKDFAKTLHSGPKHFSASQGWMVLFLRRHRVLKDVQWKSKFKTNYTDEEKRHAVAEAKRLGTGHVGRKLGIDPALICAWRIKMEKSAQKNTFWKGIKIKFGKGPKPIQTKLAPIKISRDNDAARGIVPEFEQRIVETILDEHTKEGSISYEEISRISQDVYKETRSHFKASYAWIRNFMKRHEKELENLNIDNVKKVFIPDEEEEESQPNQLFMAKRPIIIGQSRSLDTKSEKKLVEWVVQHQEKDGYVFLDQFKKFAQSLYKGNKKFAATQAWRIKFMRRNHNALKHVRFTSSFRSQYDPEEKRAIVAEAKKYGTAHVAKQTGIDHCLINSWRLKMEKSGEIDPTEIYKPAISHQKKGSNVVQFASHLKNMETDVGPGLYSARGVVPQYERKIVDLVNQRMDEEGSVSYQDVSNIARAVYRETRPSFKACYNWIKDFIKRNKKGLRHVDFEQNKTIRIDDYAGNEVLIPEDMMEDVNSFVAATLNADTAKETREQSVESWESFDGQGSASSTGDPMIVIDNPEDPTYEPPSSMAPSSKSSGIDIKSIASKKPVIIGTPVHFTKKIEKNLVEWLVERQARDGFVFTDDFRDFARGLYTGPPGKFAATNAWIAKFLRRNKLQKKINFESRLKGNNPKYEEKIIELILEQQRTEGSVSNDDIQKITTNVYKEIRPNFRACYNWIRDFIRRHKERLKDVELENVKRVFIPDDDDERDGVIVRDFDPSTSYHLMDKMLDDADNSHDSSWADMDSSSSFDRSRSQTPQLAQSSSVLEKLATQKRPVIIAPPKSLDVKTEKKLVQWMQEQQESNGCVYLDLFKQYARSIHTGPKHFAATQAWMIRFKQRNHEALKNVKICSRFRKEYSIEEKMAAVEEARRLGCNHVGRKLGINGGVIYSWKVQLEQAEKLGQDCDFSGGKSEHDESFRGQVPEFEEAIARQVLEVHRAKGSVSYEDVSLIGRQVYQETRPNFKASYNWVMEFIRKFKERFEGVNFENQRKVITEEEKLHILSEEKKYGTDHVVKKRNISASTIYSWKRSMKAKSIPIPKYKALVGSKIMKKYTKGKKFQKTYTVDEKRKAVAVAEANGITYAHLKLGISRNVLAKWIKYFRDQGENIVINTTQAMTLRKELLQKVVSWVLEQNEELGIVCTYRIQEYAQKLFQDNYSNFNCSRQWLETFITSNADKFQNIRFREKGDKDLDFTDEIKVKLSRHSEKHGGVATADLTGLSPKNIYHWRRMMKQKGYDLVNDSPSGMAAEASEAPEQKSLMQQKLEKIAMKYAEEERKTIVSEASTAGTSAVASKYKIPLPLLLKWMKVYSSSDVKPKFDSPKTSTLSREPSPERKSKELLKVRLPSVERARKSYSAEFKKEVMDLAHKIGVSETSKLKGIPSSTLYNWWGEGERDSPSRSDRKSIEKSSPMTNLSLSSEEIRTPVRVKTEPEDRFDTSSVHSGSFTDSGTETTPHGIYLKGPRKYTDEEKMTAIQTALKIGIKQASLQLDIPLSNVRRWTNNHQKTNQTVSSEKTQATSSKPLTDVGNDGVTVGIENVEEDNESNTNLKSDVSETSALSRMVQNDIHDTKRKAANEFVSEMAKKRRISASYSDVEKMFFVKDSEEKGAKYAAEKANVSLDVMYKWRQKYLPRILPPPQAPSTRRSSATNAVDINPEKMIDPSMIDDDDIVMSEKDMNEHVLAKSSETRETLIEASDIPDISVPPFSTGSDLFTMNSEFLGENDALNKEDSVIFPEVQELDVVKSVEFQPENFSAAPEGTESVSESSEVDSLKIVNVKSEYSVS